MDTESMGSTNIPGFYLRHVEQYVKDQGYTPDFGLAETDSDYISEDQLYRIVMDTIELTQCLSFGLEMGRLFALGSFGPVSQAGMSCANIGEVLKLIERYSELLLPLVKITGEEKANTYWVCINAISKHPKLNQIIVDALIASSHKVFNLLTGKSIQLKKLYLSFEEPCYANEYPKSYCKRIEFSAGQNALVFNKADLNASCITANPVDAERAVAECELQLKQLRSVTSLTQQVCNIIQSSLENTPTETVIADQLNVSERGLRRKLSQEGTSYRELLRQVRKDAAIYFLNQKNIQISQIAFKLGYQETSNFRAAFKTWTGKSPRQWRSENSTTDL
ncbi:MAG: AraC family transcriptional regulator [Pseudomonadales bacterium]|nr:AraC family transcriptional regulator [Pseudomonadales bacterium]